MLTMHIFFSGIGGAGISALAAIAHDVGDAVSGSDVAESPASLALEKRNIDIIYEQTPESIAAEHLTNPIDWLVYTAALPDDAPELVFARKNGIRYSKRDEFLAEFIREHNLRLIAVAGTHGKTTTTGMLIWTAQQLGLPVSYAIGATLSFGASGHYDPAAECFIYEADEYDRNFLHFSPEISLITSVDYDHADVYPTVDSYKAAFRQFIDQSAKTVLFEKSFKYLAPLPDEDVTVFDRVTTRREIDLAGQHNRDNAYLAAQVLKLIDDYSDAKLYKVLSAFPGTNRRFEKLAANLYSDYAHHPTEIAATLQMARELNDNVVVVYQPHQNLRQVELANQYAAAFNGATQLYWTPTYLVRDDLADGAAQVLAPADLIAKLTNSEIAESAELNDELWTEIEQARADGALVLVMGAGPIDAWVHNKLADR
jgi:UDP-N-acetylmuramate--alanine ligase